MKKALKEANQKLEWAREVEKPFVEANKKALELEAEVKVVRLKTEVSEAKTEGVRSLQI